MQAKIIALLLFFIVLFFLGRALYYTMKVQKEEDPSKRLAALRMRLVFSILLMIYLSIAGYYGWIQPHGLQP